MRKFIRRFMLTAGLSIVGTMGSFTLANAAPPAIAFGELPLGHDADISPDGKHLAMIVNIRGKYYATSQKIGDVSGKVDAVGLGEGVKPKYIKWVNNERYVISFRQSEKQRDGTPFTSSYLFTKKIGDGNSKMIQTIF